MQGERSSQVSFFGMIYEDLICADHLLRRLSDAVDFSFADVIGQKEVEERKTKQEGA